MSRKKNVHSRKEVIEWLRDDIGADQRLIETGTLGPKAALVFRSYIRQSVLVLEMLEAQREV